MKTTEQLEQQLDRMERILLALVPFRRLPLDLQRHAAEMQGDAAPVPSNARARVVMAEFEKMCAMNRFKRKPAKWPEALIQPEVDFFTNGDNTLPVVPLSSLTNRCAARSVFKVGPGEVSARMNAEATIRETGLVICSLSDAGLQRGNPTKVVHRAGWKMEHVEKVVEEEVQVAEEKKPDPFEWATKRAKEKLREQIERELDEEETTPEEDEDPPAPAPVKKWGGIELEEKEPTLAERMKAQHEKELADGTYAAHVGSFEESKCAQGIGTIPSRDEDPSDTTDDVDDDLIDEDDEDETELGPDELQTNNPIRAEFEDAAERAYQEQEKLLASGDYYLLNGTVTKKRGR